MARLTRPIGIDLFSGAGGLSLGFEQAGFDVVGAVEIDPIHACVHKFNFPRTTIIPRSAIGLTAEEIRAATGIGATAVDVVFGGAPCQGFSLIGQRALDDPRNSLVREFVRIASALDARYIVFENVKGLTVGQHRRFLAELVAELSELGYNVRKPWRVLNACSYGVPQDRERLFLLAAKRGLRLPEYPAPTTHRAGTSSQSGLFKLPAGPTCSDALADLPDPEQFEELLRCDSVRTQAWGQASAYARALRPKGARGWLYGYRRRWDSSLLSCSSRTDHTSISRRRFSETATGAVEPISRFFKLPPYGVSNTLRAGTDSSRGAFTSPRPIHYQAARCITVREMARLHGFPDWFRFHRTKWHGARQVGNSVPPPLAYAVASQVMIALGSLATRPKEVLDLGDESLLVLDMSEAASYWQVPRLINGRDRKSGATKRKQTDIESLRLLAR